MDLLPKQSVRFPVGLVCKAGQIITCCTHSTTALDSMGCEELPKANLHTLFYQYAALTSNSRHDTTVILDT